MMSKKYYIVGAGDNSGTNFSKKENEYVIAADGGLKVLQQLGIKADWIVGDFDSFGYIPEGSHVIKHPTQKDETDMMLAVSKAIELGADTIEIFGGTGGRIDHTFANFQTMLYASGEGVEICMTDDENTYFVITNQNIRLSAKQKGTFSVFAIGGTARRVNIEGGKYLLKDYDLEETNPIGISNEYIGQEVNISVGEGSLLIISVN